MKSENYRSMLIVMLLLLMTILCINATALAEEFSDQPSNSYEIQVPRLDVTDELLALPRSYKTIPMSSGMSFEATVYNDNGYAADGTYVYEGMIAANPSVLPLGTQVYVQFYGAYSWMSGVYTVHDTGGAVYGNVIDIWVPWSYGEMDNFGRREVSVTVL